MRSGATARAVLSGVIVFLFSCCSAVPFLAPSPSRQFENLLEDYFEGKFALRSEGGGPRAALLASADSLRGVSAERMLRRLHAIDTVKLSEEERIDWLQFERMLRRR